MSENKTIWGLKCGVCGGDTEVVKVDSSYKYNECPEIICCSCKAIYTPDDLKEGEKYE